VSLDTGSSDGPQRAQLTTPGAIELSRLLAQMVGHGCQAAVMEVSSHALDQGRADAVDFAAGAFTNLTQDHLDYHGTMAAYTGAKAKLFDRLGSDAIAVINAEDPAGARMAERCRANIIHTSVTQGSPGDGQKLGSLRDAAQNIASASAVHLCASHSRTVFAGPWGCIEFDLPLVGPYNLSNALQAAALAHGVCEMDAGHLRTALAACPSVPGRLETVGPHWPQAPDIKPQASRLKPQAR